MNEIQQELQRGWEIHQRKQYVEAESIYRRVLGESPANSHAWCYLGIVLHDQLRYADAVEAYRRALQLQPAFPIALNNLGNSLRFLQEFDEADACFQKAIDLKPDYFNAYKNRGTLHVWSGRLDTGLTYYEEALRIHPGEAELHRNLGVIYLLKGRFEEGWREYRWRWHVGDLHRPFRNIPLWDGSQLAGKSIVLTAEQGLGDTLNFVRFSRLLQDQGARTVIYCQPALLTILQNAKRLGPVLADGLPFEQPVDLQCSLLEVADLLRMSADSIPGEVPYLEPDANLVTYWRDRLSLGEGAGNVRQFRVGIAWQGNPKHQADAFRSFPLKYFESLAGIPGVELISLQRGFGIEQAKQWQGAKPLRLLGDQVDQSNGAFMDTAAIMQNLDLVITSDTAIAHLAGALGRPTWIALGYVPDWRWLLNREDSPWYPTVRLFRQPSMDDWQAVFAQIQRQLEILVEREKIGKIAQR